MKDRTRVVHQPAVSLAGFSSLAMPTYRASTIVFDTAEDYANRRSRGQDGYSYGLHGTPTSRTLEAQIAALEGGVRTLLVPSGQAAITLVLLAVLKPGDNVLIPDSAYPAVRYFCSQFLAERNIEAVYYDPLIGGGIVDLIDSNTRLIWMESPGSTTMEFQDIPAMVRIARERGIMTGCDNTWATPLLFKPLAHGVDISMEALTKYIGGHSDLLMGSITVNDDALYDRLKDAMRLIGIGVSPDDCALALRGLQTMGVRLAHVGPVAADFARRMSQHRSVERVLHPDLETCPGHEYWRRDFKGASGVFSAVLSPSANDRLPAALSAMRYFSIGASWGGTHSLVAPMSVRGDRTARPWTEEGVVLRISVGLEDADDLWSDLEQLLAAIAGEH